jgi:hypothetical protein
MLHKSKFMLPILAVIVGVAASAFTAANSSYNANSKDASYYWFDPSVTTYHDQNTTANEQTATGCTGSISPVCENGYTQSQLNNPNDPSQGVQTSQKSSPASQIYKK